MLSTNNMTQRSLEGYTYLCRLWGTLPWKNLSNPQASSAAQTMGENEDSYVQAYIQTQSTGLNAEMTLQLLKRRENEGQRNRWGQKTIAGRAVNQTLWPRPLKYHTAVSIKTAGLVRLTWFRGIKKMRSAFFSLPTHIYVQTPRKSGFF